MSRTNSLGRATARAHLRSAGPGWYVNGGPFANPAGTLNLITTPAANYDVNNVPGTRNELRLLPDGMTVLSTTPGIDSASVATTGLVTAPSEFSLQVLFVLLRATASFVVDTPAQVSLTRSGGGTPFKGTTPLVGLVSTGRAYRFLSGGQQAILPAGQTLNLGVDVAATGPGGAWQIEGATDTGKSEPAAPGSLNLQGIFLDPTGTRLYGTDFGNNLISEYTLTTPFDLNTASFAGASRQYDTSGDQSNLLSLFFSDDGSRMYTCSQGVASNDAVYEYILSTPWNASTATLNFKLIVSTEDGVPLGISFGDSGSKLYVSGVGNGRVFQYDLSTPFDLSTAVYSGNSLDISGETSSARQTTWRPDGTSIYVASPGNLTIQQYDLTTPWDASTGSHAGSYSTSDGAHGVFIRSNGLDFYAGFNSTLVFRQFSLDTPSSQTLEAMVFGRLFA